MKPTLVILLGALLIGGCTGGGTGGPCAADDYGSLEWEVWRGPFGGDRKTVATDPVDVDHVITDSVDRSGIWESTDRGANWQRANPPGAPFEDRSVTVAYLEDPSDDSEWLLVAPVLVEAVEPGLYKLPLQDPSGGPAEPISGWNQQAGHLRIDPHPDRPGRIAVYCPSPGDFETFRQGSMGYSPDAGKTWVQFHPNGEIHVIPAMAFGADGSLLVGSLLHLPVAEAERIAVERDRKDILDLLGRAIHGRPLPGWASAYDIHAEVNLLRIDPANGSLLQATPLDSPPYEVVSHPAFADGVWMGTMESLYRSADNGATLESIEFKLTDGSVIEAPLTVAGLTVAENPGDGSETVFVAISGREGAKRGIYRGAFSQTDQEWRFERVSAGPNREFLDYPKHSVVVSLADPSVIFAPYAEDGMYRSDDFGESGSFIKAQGGLSGYNIFGVEEDPSDPRRVFGVAQNVVRFNQDRILSSQWGDRFVSIEAATANLRGGVEVDRENPDLWIVGAGAGAGQNFNGGIWTSEDAGQNWTRVLGSEGTHNNPQVYEVLQHPEASDWILVASAMYLGEGDAGLFSSVRRAESGSFTKIVDQGDIWIVTPLPGLQALAGGAGGLFRLTLEGTSVSVESLPFAHGVVKAAITAGEHVLAGTPGGLVYRKPLADLSEAGGWEQVADLGEVVSDLEAGGSRPGDVFAGTNGDGVWRSTDSGATWDRFDTGLDSSELVIFDLELSRCGDRIYAGTLGGLAVHSF